MSFFQGRTAVLATMHGKEKVIAPILEKELGIHVVVPSNFDTDQFGTFTKEIKRSGNQLEAARKKAYEAMKITGMDLAIASEGSFRPDLYIPFVQSNLELVLLVDVKNGIEIRGQYQSLDTNMNGVYITSIHEAIQFAQKIGFPDHGVIVRKTENGHNNINKHITNVEELVHTVSSLLSRLWTKKVYIETDMRAHKNPTRMKNIQSAAHDLVKNILSACPQCNAPGFIIQDVKRGLPCCVCQRRTQTQVAHIYLCDSCGFKKEILMHEKQCEDPSLCEWCNP